MGGAKDLFKITHCFTDDYLELLKSVDLIDPKYEFEDELEEMFVDGKLKNVYGSMKNLKNMSLCLIMIIIVLTSCGGDDNDGNIDVNQAVGKWMCIQSTDTYRGQSVTGLLVGTEITIKADGTYTSTASSSTSVMGNSGTYTINGNTITARTSGYTFVMTASFNGNRMTWEGTATNGVNFHYVFQKE